MTEKKVLFMAIEKVKRYFADFGIADRVLEFQVSSATVELAAQALHCAPGHIAKTLSFKRKQLDKAILIVTAGDARIDNAKYKAEFGEKAAMLPPNEVAERIGHTVGGVCPFAVKQGVEIFLDVSLKRFPVVYPACGSGNSAIRLTIPELEEYTNYHRWVDVCKADQ